MITRHFFAYFEDSTAKTGKTGLADVTFYVKSIKHSDSALAVVTNGVVGFEVGYGVYGIQVASLDFATYDYIGYAVTASTAVTSKAVPAMRWDAAESHATELAQLDAAVSSRSTLTEAQVNTQADAALADVGLTTTVTGRIDAKISSIGSRVAAADTSDPTIDIAIVRFVDYNQELTGMTIPAAWTKLWLTIKRSKDEVDASSVLQLVVTNPAAGSTDGVLYVNQSAASVGQRTQGSLTVDQAGGSVTLDLDDDLTAVIAKPTKGNWYYDIKALTASGTGQLASGLVAVADAVTRALS